MAVMNAMFRKRWQRWYWREYKRQIRRKKISK